MAAILKISKYFRWVHFDIRYRETVRNWPQKSIFDVDDVTAWRQSRMDTGDGHRFSLIVKKAVHAILLIFKQVKHQYDLQYFSNHYHHYNEHYISKFWQVRNLRLPFHLSVCLSVCRQHSFRCLLWNFNFKFHVHVYCGHRQKSPLFFSDISFKMATWWPYWIFSCDQAALQMVFSLCLSVCHTFLYARLKNGRIMLWQCPSVRPSEFSGLFFNMLWDINLKLGLCI